MAKSKDPAEDQGPTDRDKIPRPADRDADVRDARDGQGELEEDEDNEQSTEDALSENFSEMRKRMRGGR